MPGEVNRQCASFLVAHEFVDDACYLPVRFRGSQTKRNRNGNIEGPADERWYNVRRQALTQIHNEERKTERGELSQIPAGEDDVTCRNFSSDATWNALSTLEGPDHRTEFPDEVKQYKRQVDAHSVVCRRYIW